MNVLHQSNLPALLFRMTISKQIHDQVGDPRDTMNQVLARCFDMGNDLEQDVAEEWMNAHGYGSATLAETTKDLAIAAIHRLTTEGGGADEQ